MSDQLFFIKILLLNLRNYVEPKCADTVPQSFDGYIPGIIYTSVK